MSGADLRSVASLESFAAGVAAAPATIDACLRESDDALTPRLRALERAVEEARQALARAERRLEAAQSQASNSRDSDDDGAAVAAAEAAVEEAREGLERVERAVSDVRQALGRYRAAARELDSSKAGLLAQGAAYLAERVGGARDYLSLRAPTESGGGGALETAHASAQFDRKAAAIWAGHAVLNLAAAVNIVGGYLLPQTEFDSLSLQLLDHHVVTYEMREQSRKQSIEVAVRIAAAPQISLVEPWPDSFGGQDRALF